MLGVFPWRGGWIGRLSRLQAQRESRERILANNVQELRLEEHLQQIDLKEVSASLPARTVLVEFVWVPMWNFTVPDPEESHWNSAHYIAYTLPADDPDRVQLFDLGEAARIDDHISEFRSYITGESDDNRNFVVEGDGSVQTPDPESGIALREVLFDPL